MPFFYYKLTPKLIILGMTCYALGILNLKLSDYIITIGHVLNYLVFI